MANAEERKRVRDRVRLHRLRREEAKEQDAERQEYFNELLEELGQEKAAAVIHMNFLTQAGFRLLLFYEHKFQPVKYFYFRQNGGKELFINITDENLQEYLSLLQFKYEPATDWERAVRLHLLPPFDKAVDYFTKLFNVALSTPTSFERLVELGSNIKDAPEVTFTDLENYFIGKMREWDKEDEDAEGFVPHYLPLYPCDRSDQTQITLQDGA